MQERTTDTKPLTETFAELIKTASEIQIEEILPNNCSESNQRLNAFLNENGANQVSTVKPRTFLVRLKSISPSPTMDTKAQPSDIPQDREILIQNARLLFENKDYLLARTIYSYILEKEPSDAEALEGLGTCLINLGETSSAKKCFQALWDRIGSAEALFWIGKCHLKDGNNDFAVQYFQQSLNANLTNEPIRFELYKDLGTCLICKGMSDEATACYQKALQLQPSSSIIHVNIGTLEIEKKHFNIALDYFEKALSLDSKNSRAHAGIGMVAVARNQLEQAENHLCKALDQDSQNLVALFQLLEVAYRKNQFEQIKQRLNLYLQRHPENTNVRFALAAILFKEGFWCACEKHLNSILERDPKYEKATKLICELRANRHHD